MLLSLAPGFAWIIITTLPSLSMLIGPWAWKWTNINHSYIKRVYTCSSLFKNKRIKNEWIEFTLDIGKTILPPTDQLPQLLAVRCHCVCGAIVSIWYNKRHLSRMHLECHCIRSRVSLSRSSVAAGPEKKCQTTALTGDCRFASIAADVKALLPLFRRVDSWAVSHMLQSLTREKSRKSFLLGAYLGFLRWNGDCRCFPFLFATFTRHSSRRCRCYYSSKVFC